jgi:hypothetical protein
MDLVYRSVGWSISCYVSHLFNESVCLFIYSFYGIYWARIGRL